jgi:peptide subunit release factor 1 (eRF1)
VFSSDKILTYHFEPPQPIRRNYYLCDNKFHVEYIEDLYKTHEKYGLVIALGETTYFYEIENTSYKKIKEISLVRQKNQKKRRSKCT